MRWLPSLAGSYLSSYGMMALPAKSGVVIKNHEKNEILMRYSRKNRKLFKSPLKTPFKIIRLVSFLAPLSI